MINVFNPTGGAGRGHRGPGKWERVSMNLVSGVWIVKLLVHGPWWDAIVWADVGEVS